MNIISSNMSLPFMVVIVIALHGLCIQRMYILALILALNIVLYCVAACVYFLCACIYGVCF